MFRRLTLTVALFASLLLVLAPAVRAQVPPAPTSTLPAFIRVVGSNAGVPDTISGKFSVTIRDFANNPVPNSFVTVDLSACPDIRMASDQLNPNYTVDCASRTVGGYTNAAGIATFTLLGSSWAAGSYSGLNCARAYVDGVLLGNVTVAAFDLDGAGGISIADLSLWLGDIGSMSYRARSDYDASGSLNVGDLSAWLGALGRGGSRVTGAACP